MRFSSLLGLVPAAILVFAAPAVSAERKEIVVPGEKPTNTEREPKTTVSTEELLKIIEKQDALIKALKARIKELEETKGGTPSPAPATNK